MSKHSFQKRLALLVFLLLPILLGAGALARPPLQQGLSPEEKRGKQIYLQGTSSSGKEIVANVGDVALQVPGSAMACANCHGPDGQGKPEGGISPSVITWDALTKPNGVTHASGRTHPAYTERGLELAITHGVDPKGNKLLNAMPRFEISGADLADLIAYLKRLGNEPDPGITEDKIVIGTIIPASGAQQALGQAIKAVIKASCDEINSRGGIYNRRFDCRFIETADTAANMRLPIERFLQDEQVFALTGSYLAGNEKELLRLMEQKEVPLIGPVTLYAQVSSPINRQVFYLFSGLDGQVRALVEFALKRHAAKASDIAIVSPEGETNTALIEAAKQQAEKRGGAITETFRYPPSSFDAAGLLAKLQQKRPEAILFFGSGDAAAALMKEAAKISWAPSIYLVAGSAGRELLEAPLSLNRKIFVSFPTAPSDQTPEGIQEFRALAMKYQLPAQHVVAQLSAYSAFKILEEGLKRSGKDVSREKLITALEGLDRFATGLTPPVTYGPNRRIGAMGAYMITIDLEKKQFMPAGEWVSIN